MNRADRWEAGVALAMLPAGATVLVGSAVGFLAVLTFALDGLIRADWQWPLLLWCAGATAIAWWNVRAGIAMMCAFDWRPLPMALVRSAGVVLGWLAVR